MTPRIYCGSFEAESYWRDVHHAELPSLRDASTANIVEAMDEMLAAFCEAGDTVLTAKKMDDSHAAYLHAIGFRFKRNHFDIVPCDEQSTRAKNGTSPNVFQRLLKDSIAERLGLLCADGARLEPFAVLPGTEEVARRYRLGGNFPSQKVIRAVNSKSYSLGMRDRLGIENPGVMIVDVESLLDRGAILLRHGPVLLKDNWGVSGKGNQLIESTRTLKRIAGHLAAQFEAGKQVSFVLEPYLRKQADFSCQFRIDESGRVGAIAVRQVSNRGLAFGATCPASPTFVQRLGREGYFRLAERIGSLMFEDGYWGEVCVDSMILQGGKLVPLVEINARRSMSHVGRAIENHLRVPDLKSCLTYISATNNRTTAFPDLLDLLEREMLLFSPHRPLGILPLTAGTLYPVSTPGMSGPVRGRLYFAVVFDKPERRFELMAHLGRILGALGLQAIN